MTWWASSFLENGEYWILYLFAMWVIVSICLHELAHGWAALQQGDTTPRDLGRMTFNPMVHMGGFALLAFVLTGITWGSMPVNPSRFKWGRWGEAWVAAAGPLVNLGLAVVLFTALGFACAKSGVEPINVLSSDLKLHQALWVGAVLNAHLLAFNLLPVPPFDGAAILAGVSRFTYRIYNSPNAPMIGLLVLIVLLGSGIARAVMAFSAAIGLLYASLIFVLFGGSLSP